MPLDLRVFDCPACGAPLPPAADGVEVTCAFCNARTAAGSGGAAALRERESRKEAEALFRSLGQPPGWSQKVAVVLTNGKVWLLGLPFVAAILIRVGTYPEKLFLPWWERTHQERLLHVVAPWIGWLLSTGPTLALAVALLTWSLFGARVDSRRELQAALAARPPEALGGSALCRKCGAELAIAKGALGARCVHCGADNLVQLSADWVARARKIEVSLRLTSELARRHARAGRKRVLRAAAWRVPLIGALVLAGAIGALRMRSGAGWRDLHFPQDGTSGVTEQMDRTGGEAQKTLHAIARCDDRTAREALKKDAAIRIEDTSLCEGPQGPCRTPTLFALASGDELRVAWIRSAPGVVARLAIAANDWSGGFFGDEGFGDEVARQELSAVADGEWAFRARAEVTGWYVLGLQGPRGTAVEPCVALRGR